MKIKFRSFVNQGHHGGKEKYSALYYTYEKVVVSKMCKKRKNGAECIRRYEK